MSETPLLVIKYLHASVAGMAILRGLDLTVKRGETVTWTNHDEEPHTVAAGDGSFHSPGMDANGTYSFTFSTPGSFDFVVPKDTNGLVDLQAVKLPPAN